MIDILIKNVRQCQRLALAAALRLAPTGNPRFSASHSRWRPRSKRPQESGVLAARRLDPHLIVLCSGLLFS